MNSNAIRRSIVGLSLIVGTLAGVAGVAGASPPAVQACVGTTFSGAATTAPAGFVGDVVKGFAQDDDGQPGLGDGIQLLQAGLVGDDVVVNTCNG